MVNETLVRIALDCARKGIPLPSDVRWQLTDEQWAMIREAGQFQAGLEKIERMSGHTAEELDELSESIRNLARPEDKI